MSRKNTSKPKSFEHIVPTFYLNNFCSSEGVLYVYAAGKPIRGSVPKRECAEHQFYEFEAFGQTSENSVENWLAEIEGGACEIMPRLLDRKTLTQTEAYQWAKFVGSLFVRTRKVRSQMSAATVEEMRRYSCNDRYVRDLQHNLLKQGVLHPAADIRHYVEKFQSTLEQNPSYLHVTGMARHSAVIAQELLKMRWFTLEATGGGYFVTSDCPVMTLQKQPDGWTEGAGFARENVLVVLPIAPRIAFAASSFFGLKNEVTPGFAQH